MVHPDSSLPALPMANLSSSVSHALSCYVSVSSTLLARASWQTHPYWIRPTLVIWFTLCHWRLSLNSHWILKSWSVYQVLRDTAQHASALCELMAVQVGEAPPTRRTAAACACLLWIQKSQPDPRCMLSQKQRFCCCPEGEAKQRQGAAFKLERTS